MSLRIRKDGCILCAAIHPEESGDFYIPDNISEKLSGATGLPPVIVTEPWITDLGRGGHSVHGEWWWLNQVPNDVHIEF